MADLVLVWFHFDVTCGLFWSHFGSWWPLVVSFGHLSWPCFGLILVSFVASFLDLFVASFLVSLVASFLDSFVASFWTHLWPHFWTHFGLIFGSSCGLISDSFWSHFWFLLWPHFCSHFRSCLTALAQFFGLAVLSAAVAYFAAFCFFPVAVLAFFCWSWC